MRKCNEDFISDNGIDLTKIDTKIYLKKDINWIVDKYEVQGRKYNTEISVEDLLGFSNKADLNLKFPEILDSFFDSFGDSYHSRAVGMLKYDDNTILDNLKSSFEWEPICTIEVDNNKHVINTNGMHRFLILRLLYLHAKSKCENETELESLKQKFTVPVNAVKIDLLKTYCKYLINIFQPASIIGIYIDSTEEIINKDTFEKIYIVKKIIGWGRYEEIILSEEEFQNYLLSVNSLSNDYDDSYQLTGRCKIQKFDGERLILTDEELIEYTKQIVLSSKRFKEVINDKSEKSFMSATTNFDSFKQFIEKYFSDVFDLNREAEFVDVEDSKRL